ncbi:MAG: signal peptidase II, partial [Gammaproteobacteria bacterium]
MVKWLTLSAAVVLLDQITKLAADAALVYAEPVPVVPSFFNLTLMYNRGAAFSFLSDAAGWQRWFFVAVSLGASVLLLFWLRRLKPEQWILAL